MIFGISTFWFIFWFIVLTVAGTVGYLHYYRSSLKEILYPDAVESALLLFGDKLGKTNNTVLQTGQLKTRPYMLLQAPNAKITVAVKLGRDVKLHFIATGDSVLNDNVLVNNPFMVELQSDTLPATYFKAYASPKETFKFEQLFNGPDIQSLIDFCRSHSVEIFNDSLYVTLDNPTDNSDNQALLISATDEFLDRHHTFLERL